MYLIGIDFGHGETTASYIDTDKQQQGVRALHILDGDSKESCKVESAVCRDLITGEWRFARDFIDYSSPNFTINFKAPMNEITDEQKDAFSAFIRLVFEHIIANQSFLVYNPETNEKNFNIFIACPSGWNKNEPNQIQCYKDFMSNIIPVEWIIKESDAAYFKFKAEKQLNASSVLVIDIGSSTIDFTAYGDNGVTALSDGKRHGASYVELSICKYYKENNNTYQAAEQEATELANDHVNWFNGVVHYVKKQKENYYTNEFQSLNLELRNKRFKTSLGKYVFELEEILKDHLEGTILNKYQNLLKEDMNNVKDQIGCPKKVILTGGASRMPWLQHLVEGIFTDSEIYRDSEPSYVVSDGITQYALAIYNLKHDINKAIGDFWKEYDDEKISQLISEYFNSSLRDLQLPKIKYICDNFYNGDLKYNADDFDGEYPEYNGRSCTAAFVPAMIKHNDSILHDSNGEISKGVNREMNKNLKTKIINALQNVFKTNLHGYVPEIIIDPVVNIDVKTLCINSEWDVEKIVAMTRSIYEDFFNYGDIYKDRITHEARQKFIGPFYKIQEEANVTLPENVLKIAVKSLKTSINNELNIDKLIQKCIFSIY
jgi:hypothetical protein